MYKYSNIDFKIYEVPYFIQIHLYEVKEKFQMKKNIFII